MTKQYSIIDFPADYHNGAACLSFADGHVEKHLWLEGKQPRRNGGPFDGLPTFTSVNDRDLEWLPQRATTRK